MIYENYDEEFQKKLVSWWDEHIAPIKTTSSYDHLIATPDDWLDTHLWINQLKEKVS